MSKSIVLFFTLALAASLFAEAPATAPDLLPAGSQWMGTENGDIRRPNTPQAKSRAAVFTVTKREGRKFAASYVVGGTRELSLEGVVGDHGEIAITPLKIVRGGDWDVDILDETWTAAVDGSDLKLSYRNRRNITHSADLTRQDSDSTPAPKRKRK